MKRTKTRAWFIGIMLATASLTTQASQLVYIPVNPSFGGNPGNGAYLLNNAQSQNDHTASNNNFDIPRQSDLDRFTSTLQSQLLNDILGNAAGDTEVNQTLTSGNFKINLINNGSGSLTVTVTDTTTGESSVISLATQ
ncbi:curli assembly protein CsgF [Endozoicomonas sp. YOMI1]|uniref:curli assembly protein CsgF n=1 Tax=Endozoicomonas sp. YOMI1 TaxID=2828739 RepID=UPI00214879F2|nr:curli assembly protein CsgF [Endozoicomonas sp. YOMI1]